MSYQIFAREFAPGTERHIKDDVYPTITEAMAAAAVANRRSEVYTHYVVSTKTINEAYEEANTYYAELGFEPDHDSDRFHAKWMEYVSKFIVLRGV